MTAPEPPIVRFAGVRKRFGDGPVVLEELTLAVERGEFVTFIGPSGCGKSTILRLIAGLSPVTEGELTVDGRAPQVAAAELAFVFQDPTLLPWLTVERNVAMPLRLRGVDRAERREMAQRYLRLVGLADRAGAYPRQLSGGQKMRVSLARALSLSPKLLLLDEPFGALDEMTRDHLNEELLAIRQQEAWTGFFVTHSVAEAVFLSTRIFVLGARPGHLAATVPVDLPYPRTEDTRQAEAYQRLVVAVSKLLRSVERDQR